MRLKSRSLQGIPRKKRKFATSLQLSLTVNGQCLGDPNPLNCCGDFEPKAEQCEVFRGEVLSALTPLKASTKSE